MIRPVAFFLPLLAITPCLAASSEWQDSEGGSVRILTTGLPDGEGKLKGALEVRLEPDWKTYWQNPGPSGVPPQIDVSRSPDITSAMIGYPAPERVFDGTSHWAGYKHSVAFPLTFTFDTTNTAALIDADVFLGICETICIPFQASFTFDPAAQPDNPSDAIVVQQAFAALPPAANADFGVRELRRQGTTLTVETRVPGGTKEAELFIAHEKSHLFGTPRLEEIDASHARFTIELYDEPADGLAESQADYTLVAGGSAVSGRIQLP